MKSVLLLSIILVFSCTNKKAGSGVSQSAEDKPEVVISEFQTYLDSADVTGSILIYNLNEDKYYSNNFDWAKKGYLPASTFKIANSIIALETGVVENDSSLFKWNGEERRLKIWEQDMNFKQAFHYSCVPCYQEVARKIGAKQMNEYLDKLGYGRMQVDTTNIDVFWLEGESHISQYEQIDFLKRFYLSELPISERTEAVMKGMMVIEETENYIISGKTGWSIRNGNNNGWFVGFVVTYGGTYFFATNIEPGIEFNIDMFPMIRGELTYKALKHLKILK